MTSRLPTNRTPFGADDLLNRLLTAFGKLGDFIVDPAELLPNVETGTTRRMLLLSGDHGGALLPSGGDDYLLGAPGATFSQKVAVNGVAVFEGILFDGTGKQPCVSIAASARCIFNNCTFRQPKESTANYVAIASGGKAAFNGCRFTGTPGSGTVVTNAGVAGNAGIVGCLNTTGRPHNANVTVIFEVS